MQTTEEVSLDPLKRYKLFLVEVDDDDRERVVAGNVGAVSVDTDYNSLEVDQLLDSSRIFKTTVADVTLTAKMEPFPDGTYFQIEDFSNDVYDYNESEDL